MAASLQLYFKNVTAQLVGAEHGLSLDQISALSGRIDQITQKIQMDRTAGKLPYRELPYRETMAKKVNDLAAQYRGKFDNLVVLGIGGSALGNTALQTSLNSPFHNLETHRPGPRLFVMDNVDPVQITALINYLEPQLHRTLFNVISKSGQTAETAAQFMTIQKILREKLSGAKLAGHIVATTDPKSGTLRRIVDKEGYPTLEVPPGVGGRFSVLSDVGLFSAAMCGIDINQLLSGARAMDARVQTTLMQNPAALYAVIQYLFYQKGKNLSVMMPYSYQLKDLCDWYRQLWAESLGKAQDLQGKTVHIGPTPIKALGATDQHSQVQLYREGPNDKIFTFLEVEKFTRDLTIGPAGETPELAYLAGQPFSKLINSEKYGTEYALLQSQRPCLTVRFPEITPFTVGEFIYLFEVATSYMGELLNINTYDQPAVELGKLATFALMGHKDHQDLAAKIQPVTRIDPDFLR